MAREQPRLAAILACDVVGYSRLMGRDESGTVARLRAIRKQGLVPLVARRGGRIVKLTGDGALIEFPSAVDALSAAIEMQQYMEGEARGLTEDRAIRFRIGLHLGDLIVEDEDLFGDGVNVAARLEAEAPPGGILISRTLHEAVDGRIKAQFADLGALLLKNIERPVQTFSVTWSADDWQPEEEAVHAVTDDRVPTAAAPPLALPDKPSIAVLPFQNMSGDPEQEYFGDGIAEDIITALSRQRDFFVIARNSSFSYKGTSPDIRQVGRDLGVRYVLEGSVRKAGDRLRVTGQLIDATTGNHLWAERYDRPASDIFAVQDEITESVVASIEPQLVLAEGGRSHRSSQTDLDAWSLVARAFAHKVLFSEAEARRAVGLLERAIEIDPGFGRAHAELAQMRALIAYNYPGDDRAKIMELAAMTARKAVSLDPENPVAHFALGLVATLSRRTEDAIASLSKAVDLNPNFAFALGRLGSNLAYAGRPEEGLKCTLRALRISPRDPQRHFLFQFHALVLFVARKYRESAEWSQKALQERPDFPGALRTRVAALALAGDLDLAASGCAELRRTQPGLTLDWLDRSADMTDEPRNRVLEGLRLAGFPE